MGKYEINNTVANLKLKDFMISLEDQLKERVDYIWKTRDSWDTDYIVVNVPELYYQYAREITLLSDLKDHITEGLLKLDLIKYVEDTQDDVQGKQAN